MHPLQRTASSSGSVLSKTIITFSAISTVLLVIIRTAMVFCYDPEITGIDNNFIYPVIQQLQGGSIYPDPEQYPFAVNPYAPLLFYLSYIVCEIFGINGSNPIEVYFVIRGICLLADVLTIVILFRIMKRYLNIPVAIAGFATVALFFLVSYWSFTVMRSDSLLLLFYALILLHLLRYLEKPRNLQLAFLALLCNAALFSKQNGLYIPIMIPLIFILQKQIKAALLFALFFGIILIPLAGICILVYEKHFYSHLVTALNNRLDVKWFYLYIFKRMAESFVIFPFAAGTWLAIDYFLRPTDVRIKIVSIAALSSIIFSLLIAFKWGSSIAYLNESMFALTIILAFTAKEISTIPLKQKLGGAVLVCGTVIFIHIAAQLYFYHLNNFGADRLVYNEQKQLTEELLAMIGSQDVYVFADDVNGTFFKNMLRDRLVAPNKDAVDCCTLPDGNFDYSLFKQGFETGKVKYLVFQEQYIPEKFHDISFTHYKKLKVRFGYSIYEFRQGIRQ